MNERARVGTAPQGTPLGSTFHFPGNPAGYPEHMPPQSPALQAGAASEGSPQGHTAMSLSSSHPGGRGMATSPRSAAISMLASAASASTAMGLDGPHSGQYSPHLGNAGGMTHQHPYDNSQLHHQNQQQHSMSGPAMPYYDADILPGYPNVHRNSIGHLPQHQSDGQAHGHAHAQSDAGLPLSMPPIPHPQSGLSLSQLHDTDRVGSSNPAVNFAPRASPKSQPVQRKKKGGNDGASTTAKSGKKRGGGGGTDTATGSPAAGDSGGGEGDASGSGKKKPTRRYNASCDACRARKRKCPGRDPVTGETLCRACEDRGVECTYGSLGEPSRLRRADNENEKLKSAIREALDAGDLGEKDRILQSFLGSEKGSKMLEKATAAAAASHRGGSTGASGSGRGGKKRRFSQQSPEYGYRDYSGDEQGTRAGSFAGYDEQDQKINRNGFDADGRHPQNGESSGLHADREDYLEHGQHSPRASGNGSLQHGEYSESANNPATPAMTSAAHPGSMRGPHGARNILISPKQTGTGTAPASDGSGEAIAQFTSNKIAGVNEDEDILDLMEDYVTAALPGGMMQGAPDADEEERLLSYYFCWLNPRYSLLDEAEFRRSKMSGDQTFCTPFLLWSIYAHAAIHCPGSQGRRREYRARAHLLMSVEYTKGRSPSLTTSQGEPSI